MKRERMPIKEAAAFLAEKPLQYQAKVNIFSPFPPVKVKLETEINRWVRRIREGTQALAIACRRSEDRTNGQVLYGERDLVSWANRKFPRQEAFNV